MPTYTYKCQTCSAIKDETQSIHDTAIPTCICGESMQKIITGCNFNLKGGGWGRDFTEKKEHEAKSSKLKEKMIEKERYNHFK
jgi:putative FmdB family regulatory protein